MPIYFIFSSFAIYCLMLVVRDLLLCLLYMWDASRNLLMTIEVYSWFTLVLGVKDQLARWSRQETDCIFFCLLFLDHVMTILFPIIIYILICQWYLIMLLLLHVIIGSFCRLKLAKRACAIFFQHIMFLLLDLFSDFP